MRRLGSVVAAVALAGFACTGASPALPATTATGGTTSSAPSEPAPATAPRGSTAPGTASTVVGSEASCWTAEPAAGTSEISFADVTADWGLMEPLVGMHAHAAAWGDPNGDGRSDLVIGTFADRPPERYQVRGASGPSPDRLLLGLEPFVVDQTFPGERGRTSGAVFADLDRDGDDDLVLAGNAGPRAQGLGQSVVYRNDEGRLTAVEDSGLPAGFNGRSVAVLDFDADGWLDLFIVEDRFGRSGSSVLLRNQGDLRFVPAEAGIPAGVGGLGVATSDHDGDGYTELFVAGSNRLFLSAGPGAFREADASALAWEVYGNEDDVAGAAIADLNRDGRLDLVVGHHYNSTLAVGARVPVRVYLNEGVDGTGDIVWADVTTESGLPGLTTKAPHVEINDFDNDGWPDLLTTASAGGGSIAAVFRHLGLEDGVPRFDLPEGLGDAQYWVTGPSEDVDRDGRLDLMLVEWEPSLPSLLLRNETRSGNWLELSTGGELGTGIGTRISIYRAGEAGNPAALLGSREIVVSEGYASGRRPAVHFGLGAESQLDVVVQPPFGGTPMVLEDVAANRRLQIPAGC